MKKISALIFIITCNYYILLSQSNPVVLRPDLTIDQLMLVHGGATRIAMDPVDQSLYYSCYNGKIYKVIIPLSGNVYDTLVYSISEHGLTVVQGMEFYDSTLYISGNIDPDSAYTIGRISAGRLQPNGTRSWYTLAQSVPYETAGWHDHLFSGLKINQTGDTLLICSGSRGDHNEEESRDSLFPELRNLAITSVILQIPTTSVNVIIPNDTLALDTLGMVFARGIRNTYDFAYSGTGELFGAENSGDRDMEDEINWLRPGLHYGFPWMMGSLYTPQQFANYDPTTDLLLNHASGSWVNNKYYNDTAFPQIPAGLQMMMPCINLGPDAAIMRDSATGLIYDAAAISQPLYSFTPHRSPLGLTFDHDSILGSDLCGRGFLLSYTRGNALLNDSSPILVPFNDHSEDLLLLDMVKDSANDNYSFHATRIVEGFGHPVDAVLSDTNMYVIENDFIAMQYIWIIHFPRNVLSGMHAPSTGNQFEAIAYPVPADKAVSFYFRNKPPGYTMNLDIYNQFGQTVYSVANFDAKQELNFNTEHFAAGLYYFRFYHDKCCAASGRFTVMH